MHGKVALLSCGDTRSVVRVRAPASVVILQLLRLLEDSPERRRGQRRKLTQHNEHSLKRSTPAF
jgi:hypothetical protein